MLKLLLKLTIVALGGLLIAWLFDYGWRFVSEQQPSEFNWRLFPHPPRAEKYQVVSLGNSHASSGFDFSHYTVPAINFGSVAQRFAHAEAILRQHKNEIASGAAIVVDVSHISFSHQELTVKDGIQQELYSDMSPFLIPKINWGAYIQKTFLPFILTANNLRREHSQQLIDEQAAIAKAAWLENVASSAAELVTTRPPELLGVDFYNVAQIEQALASPSAVPPENYVDNTNFVFNKWYYTEEFDPSYFAVNRDNLKSLLSYIKENNWRPVLVTIPVAAVLEQGLLDDYKQRYLYDNLAQLESPGVPYWDYTDHQNFTNNLIFFGDVDHLNQDGAKVFSYLLLQDLIEGGYLPATADGYDYSAPDQD